LSDWIDTPALVVLAVSVDVRRRLH